MPNATTAAAVLAIALLGTVPTSPPQDPQRNANVFTIEAGEHELKDLIDRAAIYLKRNYLYEEQSFAGNGQTARLKIHNRLDLGRADVERVLSDLAFARGFALLAVDEQRGIFEWIVVNGPRRGELDSRAKQLTPQQALAYVGPKTTVTTAYNLTNIAAQQAQNSLRPFFASQSNIGALTLATVGNANTMVLRGFSDQVNSALRLLQRVDTAAPDTEDFYDWQQRMNERVEAIERKLK